MGGEAESDSILELAIWLDRKHSQVGFYLTQELSGRGCFNAYLKCSKKRDDESCRYCGSLVDNAEHTLFLCARWGVARKAVGQAFNSLLIRWSLSCSNLKKYGCLSSHFSPW